MTEFKDIPDHDERTREPDENQYYVAALGCGRIVCYLPGLRLVDFYRTHKILAQPLTEKDKGEHT